MPRGQGKGNAAISDLDASAEVGAGYVGCCVYKKNLVEDLGTIRVE